MTQERPQEKPEFKYFTEVADLLKAFYSRMADRDGEIKPEVFGAAAMAIGAIASSAAPEDEELLVAHYISGMAIEGVLVVNEARIEVKEAEAKNDLPEQA